MNNCPIISIIVPVYNAEAFLSRGIESLLAQSFRDFELILVDDGSSDGSGALCDKYAQLYQRIQVIHQRNAGVSAARNAGLKVARGEWVTFVDSDDLVLDCFLECLINAAHRDERIDLSYCGYAIVEGNATIKTYRSGIYVGQEQMHELLSSTFLLYRCSPWAKLFRRSIIADNGLQFDINLSISEDRLFFYKYLVNVRGIAVTSQVGYLYGSFSPTSLKHKQVPVDMLAYRQRSITAAAHDVIRHFSLGNGNAYLISRHLVLILFELMRCVYQESGVSRKTVERQDALFEELFDNKSYDENLRYDQRWNRQLEHNRLMRYMVNHQFNKMNRRLHFDDVNLSIRRFAYRLLKQRWVSEPVNHFEQAITYVNRFQ